MPLPANRKQVQLFIGLINYLSKVSLRFSEFAELIRELSKDKVLFNWGPVHQQAFTHMKKEISSAPVLAYHNPKKQNMLQTDASIKSLGVCLLQEEKPVHFESNTLTDAQKGYVALELESLAVAWAREKFHHFFTCQSFHFRNWPETTWSYIVKEFKPSNSKITADTGQNFCLPLYRKIYTWFHPPACRLFGVARWSTRYQQAAKAAYTSHYQSIEGKKWQLE